MSKPIKFIQFSGKKTGHGAFVNGKRLGPFPTPELLNVFITDNQKTLEPIIPYRDWDVYNGVDDRHMKDNFGDPDYFNECMKRG